MAIQIVPAQQDFRQLALLQLLGQAGQRGVENFQGFQAQERALQQEQALIDLLAGRAPTLGQVGAGTGMAGSPELAGQRNVATDPGMAGLIPGMSPQQAAQLGAAGLARPVAGMALEQAFAAPPAPMAVRPGGALVDPRTGQPIYQAPFEPPGPLSSAGKIATDLGVDIRTPEGRAAVEAVLKAGSNSMTIQNLPQSAILPQAQAPRQIGNVSDVAQALIDPQSGAVDRQTLATFNVPGYGGPIPGTRGAQLRSAYDEAVNTLIYLQTGKAATDEERAAANRIYMPSPLDSAGEVADKFGRLQSSLTSFLEVSARGQPGATQPPAVPPVPTTAAGPSWLDQIISQGASAFQGATGGGAGSAPQPQLGTGGPVAPPIGTLADGFRFKGGNPNDPASWEPAP